MNFVYIFYGSVTSLWPLMSVQWLASRSLLPKGRREVTQSEHFLFIQTSQPGSLRVSFDQEVDYNMNAEVRWDLIQHLYSRRLIRIWMPILGLSWFNAYILFLFVFSHKKTYIVNQTLTYNNLGCENNQFIDTILTLIICQFITLFSVAFIGVIILIPTLVMIPPTGTSLLPLMMLLLTGTECSENIARFKEHFLNSVC